VVTPGKAEPSRNKPVLLIFISLLEFQPQIEMKAILISALAILYAIQLNAQETYTVNGNSYELKTEVSGSLNLLWNVIDNQYRYFIQKDNTIKELVNTRNDKGKYNEEYITTLKEFTADDNQDLSKVKLLLYSLKNFVNEYNAKVDPNYAYDITKISVKTRLGFSVGMTNNPFVINPDNEISAVIGAELELYDDNRAKRHGAFMGLRHVFENDKLNYSNTELSLGYRFRIIYQENFNIYTNVKLATFSSTKGNITYLNDMGLEITQSRTSTNFDAPVIFGIGADIKVGENGFLTLSYGELFALFLENEGNFSTDFSIGYKFNL